MRVFAIALALFALTASAAEVDLDDNSYEAFVKDNEFALVMFFAPWCGHCKTLKPEFTKAAETADAEGKFKLAKVDCTADDAKALCEKFGVKGYPTLKFFKKGEAAEYAGPRDAKGILSWLDKKSGPAAVTLADAAALKAFEAKKPALVGFFDGETDGQKAFYTAAGDSKLEDFPAGQVLDKKLFGSRKNGDIVFIPATGDSKTFAAGTDGKALAQTLFESTFPLAGEVSGENFQKYVTLGKPLYLLFVEPTDPNKDQLVGDLEKVAAKHPNEAFTWIDAIKYKAQVKGMGGSGVVPAIIRMSSFTNTNKPIALEKENMNEAIIGEWVDGIASGKYKYAPKSEPLPEDNGKPGTVQTIVAKNFADFVSASSTKSLFLDVYAPWCGHCKKLVPEWDALAKQLENNSNVVIGKVDGTANDLPDSVDVKGFPTLLFWKAGSTEAIAYQGTRDAENMSKWVRSQLNGEDASAGDDKDEL